MTSSSAFRCLQSDWDGLLVSGKIVNALFASARPKYVRKQSAKSYSLGRSIFHMFLAWPTFPQFHSLLYKSSKIPNFGVSQTLLNQLLHSSLTPGCLGAGSTHVIRKDCVTYSNLINYCSCLNASFNNLRSCLIFSQTIEELDVDCEDPAHHLVPYDTHYSPDASCVWLKLLQVLDWFMMFFSYDSYICFISRWPKRIESRLISWS